MINQQMLSLGKNRSSIRELFEYGLRQAQLVGKENVFDYSLGNPSIPAPEAVNEAFVSIIQGTDSLKVHGYTPATGLPETRAAIAEDLNKRFNAAIRPENIFVTCGAAPSLIALFRALASPGDEIMCIAPYFPEYRPFIEANGAVFVPVPPDLQTFQIDLEALSSLISPKTQAIVINSPNNPSGVIYTEETIKGLAAILYEKAAEIGHPIYLISDEPYRELVYDGASLPFLPDFYKDTIICYSYSKSLSLPGERIGYICVPDQVTQSEDVYFAAAGAARASGHVCAPALQQRVIALCTQERPNISAYNENRLCLYEALTSYGYECVRPQGAFYMFIKAPGQNAKAFSEAAKQKNLLVVPGDDFGTPTHFRISTCVSLDMIKRSLPLFKELIDAKAPYGSCSSFQIK